MISFALPRFSRSAALAHAQARARQQRPELDRQARYDHPRALSHRSGAPRHPQGRTGRRHRIGHCHGDRFFEDVVEMVRQYLNTRPDPQTYDFLQYSFAEMTEKFGGVVGTTFKSFPSYPQRYTERCNPQPPAPQELGLCRVEPIKPPRVATRFTEDDIVVREFLPNASRTMVRKGKFVAA